MPEIYTDLDSCKSNCKAYCEKGFYAKVFECVKYTESKQFSFLLLILTIVLTFAPFGIAWTSFVLQRQNVLSLPWNPNAVQLKQNKYIQEMRKRRRSSL